MALHIQEVLGLNLGALPILNKGFHSYLVISRSYSQPMFFLSYQTPNLTPMQTIVKIVFLCISLYVFRQRREHKRL
jgi:hypothetical protein